MRAMGVAARLAGASATTPASEVGRAARLLAPLGGDGWLVERGWTSSSRPAAADSCERPGTASPRANPRRPTRRTSSASRSNTTSSTARPPASLADLPAPAAAADLARAGGGHDPRGHLRAARARDVGAAVQQHERHDSVVLGELHRAVGDRLHGELVRLDVHAASPLRRRAVRHRRNHDIRPVLARASLLTGIVAARPSTCCSQPSAPTRRRPITGSESSSTSTRFGVCATTGGDGGAPRSAFTTLNVSLSLVMAFGLAAPNVAQPPSGHAGALVIRSTSSDCDRSLSVRPTRG